MTNPHLHLGSSVISSSLCHLYKKPDIMIPGIDMFEPPEDCDNSDRSDDESLGRTSTCSISDIMLETAARSFYPNQSPPLQMMDRSGGFDPFRIPSSVFEASNIADWSTTSNDSLFSLHLGNHSLSGDRSGMWGTDFTYSRELLPKPPDLPSKTFVVADDDATADEEKCSKEKQRSVTFVQEHDDSPTKGKIVGDIAGVINASDEIGSSATSFSFPVLTEIDSQKHKHNHHPMFPSQQHSHPVFPSRQHGHPVFPSQQHEQNPARLPSKKMSSKRCCGFCRSCCSLSSCCSCQSCCPCWSCSSKSCFSCSWWSCCSWRSCCPCRSCSCESCFSCSSWWSCCSWRPCSPCRSCSCNPCSSCRSCSCKSCFSCSSWWSCFCLKSCCPCQSCSCKSCFSCPSCSCKSCFSCGSCLSCNSCRSCSSGCCHPTISCRPGRRCRRCC